MDDPAVARFTLSVARTMTGLWCITSPELKGLLVAERSFAEAMEAVPFAVDEIRRALKEAPDAAEQSRVYAEVFA